jgi:nucleoside-diphosphate-sugar epimerase
VPLVSGGRAKLCAVYAGDLADALVLCATHPAAARRAFILADPEPLTWSAWLGRIAHSLDAPPPRRSVPRAAAVLAGAATEAFYRFALPGRAPPLTRYRAEVASTNLEFSGERARRELGWSPRVGLEEGLRRTAAWARPLIREA